MPIRSFLASRPSLVRTAGARLRALTASARRGAASLDVARRDPSRLPDIEVGGWFQAGWRRRAARRALLLLPRSALALVSLLGARGLSLALEASFWGGVRSAATKREWQRLTRSSYVVLLYHGIGEGGDGPGDDRLRVPPRRFRRQLRLLEALRFRPLAVEELLSFHRDPGRLLPRRCYVLSADDGFESAVRALEQAPHHHPQLFLPTRLAGARAPWAPEERIATWDEVRRADARGVSVGSHSRRHASLPELSAEALEDELAGSLADLRGQLGEPALVVAFPHGRQDPRVRRAAAAAGYRAAYTTEPGRNGAGTDPYRLRRISVKAWDGSLTFLWKACTGEPLPAAWERWRLWCYRARRRYRAS